MVNSECSTNTKQQVQHIVWYLCCNILNILNSVCSTNTKQGVQYKYQTMSATQILNNECSTNTCCLVFVLQNNKWSINIK